MSAATQPSLLSRVVLSPPLKLALLTRLASLRWLEPSRLLRHPAACRGRRRRSAAPHTAPQGGCWFGMPRATPATAPLPHRTCKTQRRMLCIFCQPAAPLHVELGCCEVSFGIQSRCHRSAVHFQTTSMQRTPNLASKLGPFDTEGDGHVPCVWQEQRGEAQAAAQRLMVRLASRQARHQQRQQPRKRGCIKAETGCLRQHTHEVQQPARDVACLRTVVPGPARPAGVTEKDQLSCPRAELPGSAA